MPSNEANKVIENNRNSNRKFRIFRKNCFLQTFHYLALIVTKMTEQFSGMPTIPVNISAVEKIAGANGTGVHSASRNIS